MGPIVLVRQSGRAVGRSLTDFNGDGRIDLLATTLGLRNRSATDPNKALAVLSFFSWAFKSGKQMAVELDYVPMPDNVVKLIESAWRAQIKTQAGQAVWK